jgi:hypothetical protein
MANYIFDNVFMLIEGPLVVRLAAVVDLLTLCHCKGCDYRILWCPPTEDCGAHLSDLIRDPRILSRTVKDVSLLHNNTTYYYNPEVPLFQIMENTKIKTPPPPSSRRPTNDAESGFEVDTTNCIPYEWLVIQNSIDGKRMVPPPSIDYTHFLVERRNQFRTIEFDYVIEGYLNAMYSNFGTNSVGIYFNNPTTLVDPFYINIIRNMSTNLKLFVGFHHKLTPEQRRDIVRRLKTITKTNNTQPDGGGGIAGDRVFHLKISNEEVSIEDRSNNYLDDILTIKFLTDGCAFIITDVNSIDEYIRPIISMNLTPLYVVDCARGETRMENGRYDTIVDLS